MLLLLFSWSFCQSGFTGQQPIRLHCDNCIFVMEKRNKLNFIKRKKKKPKCTNKFQNTGKPANNCRGRVVEHPVEHGHVTVRKNLDSKSPVLTCKGNFTCVELKVSPPIICILLLNVFIQKKDN